MRTARVLFLKTNIPIPILGNLGVCGGKNILTIQLALDSENIFLVNRFIDVPHSYTSLTFGERDGYNKE
jgi:hypothetical protein